MSVAAEDISPVECDARLGRFADRVKALSTPVSAERGTCLSREGESCGHVTLLTSGFAVAAKRTVAGSLQNVTLFVPGDIVDHESFTLGSCRSTTTALTPIRFHTIDHLDLRDLLIEDSGHAAAFWRYVAFQGALAQEWLLNIGQRTAYVRTAHFLCEIIYRSQFVPGSDEQTCEMPLTQIELADTLGLSVVHVNRTLQRLRQDGVIRVRRGRLDVLAWNRFSRIAGFEPAYLDLGG